MTLTGKSAIVTGAASGIGAEIARVFAEAGAKVCIADLNEPQATVKNSISVRMDVTNEAQVERGIAEAVRQMGGVDILVS
ncbi:MAG TPA: SDR family NAD(P)-dependent oxidoreductase, partial [Burkholderiales bacterium]|nr:SDR family NAD(P)-dependent oxidoreductase [Burkholderiales bacterium]